MNKWMKGLLDPLYRDYLLRDFFAKIIPGAVLCFAFAAAFRPDLIRLAARGLVFILFAGFCWVVGFGIQQLAEIVGALRQRPARFKDEEKRYELRISFRAEATEDELNRVERYAIIKEASGNLAMALVLSSIVSSVTSDRSLFVETRIGYWFLGVGVVLAISLVVSSWSHARKEYKFMEKVLERRKGDSV